MSDDDSVLLEIDDAGVATVTLNRPDRMNALDDAMVTSLWRTMQAVDSDPSVRVVVLTGAGRAFCAGADVTGFGGQTPLELIRKLPRLFDQNRRPDYQTRHTYLPSLDKPVLAMVNGAAVGLGLLYALCCDVRFAAEDAVLTTGWVRLGLAAEYGASWLLPRVVGHANALDLLLSSRKVRGAEARSLGLVNFSVPGPELVSRTMDYARAMAAECSPLAMRTIKRQVWDAPFQTLAEAVIETNRDMLVTNASADHDEGKAAFRERRAPRFDPLPPRSA